jgi:hypothetical protein
MTNTRVFISCNHMLCNDQKPSIVGIKTASLSSFSKTFQERKVSCLNAAHVAIGHEPLMKTENFIQQMGFMTTG